MDIVKRLAELGWVMPEPPKPIAAYVPSVRVGNLLYVSGQLPWRGQQLLAVGKVPDAVSIADARVAAAQCVVCALAVVGTGIEGDWSRLVRAVRVGVFVQCQETFTAQAEVANGASDLLLQVMGDAGRHARVAVGVNALPLGATVEVECSFEVR